MPKFCGLCGKGKAAQVEDPRHPDIIASEQAASEGVHPASEQVVGSEEQRPAQQWLPRAGTKAFQSALNVKRVESVLEMCCDHLCVRTMTVCYTNRNGNRRTLTQSGFNVKIFLPENSTDVEVTFQVVGGSFVRKIDRTDDSYPFVKDDAGNFVPEKFEYKSPPEYVQYFVRGSIFQSKVTGVDERTSSESLLEMVSRDFRCLRSMRVDYLDAEGERQTLTGSGFRVAIHVPSAARNVEVSFQVVGGGPVCKVDRRDPGMPFVKDANDERPPEIFCYEECPPCVQYEIRGVAWRAHISRVIEQSGRGGGEEDFSPTNSTGPDGRTLFDGVPDRVPAVGGIVDLQEAHSEYLLPSEVLLFEPSPTEIHMRGEVKRGSRLIFLNQPLTEDENAGLLEYRQALVKRGVLAAENDPFPRYMGAHSLRLIQSAKYNMQKAADMLKTCVTERVRRLPIAEADVLNDLRLGFAYWHGRDKKCRPCLVLRLERLGPLLLDKERAVRLVIFVLEYGLRFAMVPGRVENWVVVIDLQNVMSIINPLHIGSLIGTASAIGTTLEKVYCGRMVWIKIVNMPGSGMLTRAINGVIPTEKKDKVEFPTDAKAALRDLFEPNQLERRYGGTSPDLKPEESYPFKFFPNPRGRAARENTAQWEKDADTNDDVSAMKSEGLNDVEDFSLHESATLPFHEGVLWDESSDEARARWLDIALRSALTPEAAAALTQRHGKQARLCRSMSDWMMTVNPAVVGKVSLMRSTTAGFGESAPEPEVKWATKDDIKILSL